MKFFLAIMIFFSVLIGCNGNRTTPASNPDNLFDTTSLLVRWDSSTCVMTATDVWLNNKNNNLLIAISNENGQHFDLKFLNKTNHWVVSELSQPSATDCLFVSSQFRILNQTINLNKHSYNRGDRLQGTIGLIIIGRKAMVREPFIPFADKRNWDTIRMQGNLNAPVN